MLAFMKDKALLTGVVPKDAKKPVGGRLTTDSEAIDSFSFHVAAVCVVYFLSFLLLKVLTFFLSFAGKSGAELAANFWGINFIILGDLRHRRAETHRPIQAQPYHR